MDLLHWYQNDIVHCVTIRHFCTFRELNILCTIISIVDSRGQKIFFFYIIFSDSARLERYRLLKIHRKFLFSVISKWKFHQWNLFSKCSFLLIWWIFIEHKILSKFPSSWVMTTKFQKYIRNSKGTIVSSVFNTILSIGYYGKWKYSS